MVGEVEQLDGRMGAKETKQVDFFKENIIGTIRLVSIKRHQQPVRDGQHECHFGSF